MKICSVSASKKEGGVSPLASEAEVCRGSNTPNYTYVKDTDMYVPQKVGK